MKKLLNTLLVVVAAAIYTDAATYYVDYSNGSDANSGTSMAAPWKRAPGMKGFAGRYSHIAGDRFIFKGGVTWPVACFQMKITAGGSSDTNRDYYGADPAWYGGSAFSRPLFDFQHTLVGPGWTAAAGVLVEGCNYITFENIELAHHRTPAAVNGLVTWGTATICLNQCGDFTLSKCVIRDWDMKTPIPVGSSGGGGIIRVGSGDRNVVTHCLFHQKNVAVKTGTCIWNIGTVAYSEFHSTTTSVMSASLVHNNYIHHLTDPTDPAAHTNVMLCNGGLRAYNNLIHDIPRVAQVIFLNPGYYGTPGHDWIYNNVIYNVAQPCIAIDTDGKNAQTAASHIFNNTLVAPAGSGNCIRVGYRNNGPFAFLETRNNHYITQTVPILKDNPAAGGAYVTTFLDGPNLTQTPEQAAATGYVVANAYQPVDANRPTLNAGVSLSAYFGSDIRGVARGQLGAWDTGAYEYKGSGSTQPTGNPGNLIQDTNAKSVSETSGSVTLNVARTGGSFGTVSCAYSTVNGTATAGVHYKAGSGIVTWANGDTAKKAIQITVLNTSTVGSKDFSVVLSSATGGATVGSPASAVVTITGSGTVQPPPTTEPDSILTNPSFESGLTGWTASGSVGVGQLPYQPTHGSRMAAFNWGQTAPSGVISQSFETVPGQAYAVTFDAGALAYNYDEQRVQITVRGSSLLLSQAVSVFGSGGGSSKWVSQTYPFVADSPITTLTFRDISPATINLDLMLDNIRVRTDGPPPAQPPTIATQPESLTVTEGSSATFTVVASGTGTLNYQWQFDGSPIPEATEASFTIDSAQAAHAGRYSVVVSTDATSTTSLDAELTVTPAPPSDPGSDPQDPGSDPQDPGTDPQDPGTDPQDPGTDPQDPGTDPQDPGTDPQDPGTDPQDPGTDPQDPGSDPQDPGSDPQDPGTDPQDPGTDPQDPGTDPQDPGTDPQDPGTDPQDPGTDPQDPGTDPQDPGTDPQDPGTDPQDPGTDPQDPGTDPQDPGTDPQDTGEEPSAGPLIANGGFELGMAGWSGSGNCGVAGTPYQASEGEKLAAFNWGQSTPNGTISQNFNTVSGQTYALSFDAGVLAYNCDQQRMRVVVTGDKVELLSRTISVFGKGGGSTAWTSQSFTFVANGSSAVVTFQDVSQATWSLDLLLDNVQVSVLTTSPEPPKPPLTIVTQPAGTKVTAGQAAAFSVQATGAGVLVYQWYFNGKPIPGATDSTYSISSAQAGHAGNYDVVVADLTEWVRSQTAVLTVTIPVVVNGFTNGSFESGYTGWTASGYLDLTSTQSFPGADGNKLVRFNAGDKPANGLLTQTFATTPGQLYSLSCKVGTVSFNTVEQRISVTVQGQGTLLSKAVSVFGTGGGSTRWVSQTFTFVADSSNTTLTFADASPHTKAIDLLLDQVSVVPGK
ncbi:MAG: DUF642 domain-containing protein [Verrucomicrobiia bacterium]